MTLEQSMELDQRLIHITQTLDAKAKLLSDYSKELGIQGQPLTIAELINDHRRMRVEFSNLREKIGLEIESQVKARLIELGH